MKGLKPLPYLRMKETKIDTLFKAQTPKMAPYSSEKTKSKNRLTAMEKHNLYKNHFAYTIFNLNRSFVFCLTGFLRDAILADTI